MQGSSRSASTYFTVILPVNLIFGRHFANRRYGPFVWRAAGGE